MSYLAAVQIGDLVKWTWHLSRGDWVTHTGILVNSRIRKTDYEKVIVYEVLLNTGELSSVREDEPSLERVA